MTLNFTSLYNRKSFTQFLSNDFLSGRDFILKKEECDLGQDRFKRIKEITFLGMSDDLDLAVYEVKHQSENDPRITLTREIFRFMKNSDKSTANALVFFVSEASKNYRFSLVTMDFQRTNKKIKREFSNPKRYSFFLGEDAKTGTPERFLIQKGRIKNSEDLKSRFSVEVVNKEFYTEIQKLFYKLIGAEKYTAQLVKYDGNDEKKRGFAVRLLGRLIFTWFLKKKCSKSGNPLIPEKMLSVKMVEETIGHYYKEVLEPLFFEILNTTVKNRSERLLTQYNLVEYAKEIPFLNGGLFEPDKEDIYIATVNEKKIEKMGMIFNKGGRTIINNSWFVEFFTLLETYNFTIDENTTIDIDLSVDPEMLGRIFENLLAEINPETGSSARNATGSFYTPRPIVDFMVNESIKSYLKTVTNIDGVKIDSLLQYEEEDSPLTQEETTSIIESLDKMKILDPACGSGAFPMGMLQKILLILDKIDADSERWRDLIIRKIPSSTGRNFMRKILKKEDPKYIHKIGLIRDTIFGVDIQPIATEISKLRVFLSLIVDTTIDDDADNRGVHELPNLEFKFVCANTLIGLQQKQVSPLETISDVQAKVSELSDIRELYFDAYGKEKLKYKKEFLRLHKDLNTLFMHGESGELQKIIQWNPFANKPSKFFDAKWMFGLEAGFDIVIGNPPFIQLQKFSGQQIQKDLEAQEYKSFAKTGDMYQLFYERGNQLLKDGGHLCFITSNKWMRANYGKKSRSYFTENTTPQQLIDFGGYKVFESATVDTNILVFEKSKKKQILKACIIGKDFNKTSDIVEYVQKNFVELKNLSEESWIISTKEEFAIRKRIEEVGTPLKEWDISINYGIKTGFNEAFIISGDKKDELIAQDPKSAEIIKPILRGRDIKKYKAEFADKWLINSHNGYNGVPRIDINDYPAVKEHLDQYWTQIEKRYDKGETPYNLRNCAYVKEFEKEKIVWKRIGSIIRFSYSTKNELCLDSTVIATGRYVKYLTALLNSTLHIKALIDNSPKTGTGDAIISVQALEPLFVYKPIKSQQLSFEILVDYILFAKENDLTVEADTLESVVNGMVYDLYFEKEMKEADCYITDRITEVIQPFKNDDSDEFKTEYIKKLHKFCRNDEIIFRGLIHRRNIKVVKIINGDKK